jgi:hypothetical protein
MKPYLLLPLLAWLWTQAAVAGHDVDIQIVSDHGRSYPTYPQDSGYYGDNRRSNRAYVEALPNANYGIHVSNQSGRRVGIVIAVDGRNIISGQASSLSPSERMYILRPGERQVYDGWRTGKNRVNRFYFTDASDSYAYGWNDTAQIGTIAAAVYFERHYDDDQKERRGGPPSARPHEGPGTGFGEDEYSPSRRVEFDPESVAASRYFFRYEWRENLCRRGVIQCRRPPPPRDEPEHWHDNPPPRRPYADPPPAVPPPNGGYAEPPRRYHPR